jgi:hypothetical protein
MIDPRQLSPEDLQRLLILLRGAETPPPQQDEQVNNRLAQFMRGPQVAFGPFGTKQPQVVPGTQTSTIGQRG